MAGIAQSPHHALLVHDPFRSARCRYPGAAVLLLIRRSSLSLYGQNHRPENGRRSRALENGRRGRSQRFCREKRLHKRRKTVGGQKHGFLPNRTLHPSLLVSAQRGHELRRRHFAADVTAKNNREALPSMTEGLLCFVQLHLRTFPLRTRPAKNELIASQAPNSPQKQTLSFHKLNEIYYFLYFCIYFLQKTINPKTL